MAALREILVAFGITVDTSPIKKGEAAADGFKAKLQQLGGVIAATFAIDKIKDFVMGTIAAGDALGDQAARLNISTRALEEWTYAGKFADIQGAELDGIFNKLAKSSVAAGDATSEQGQILKKLHVNVKDANGDFKDTGTLFEEVGLALGSMGDATQRTALSMQFFGKTAGPKVLQLFKDGPEGIKKFRAEFEELGGGMGDFVEQAGAIDDQMHRLDLAWISTKTKIVSLVLPAVSWLITAMTKTASFVTKLAKETNILQTALGAFAAFAIAKAVMLAAAYWPVVAPFLAWAAAMAGLILVGDDLITFFQGGDSVIGRAIDAWFGEGSAEKVRVWTKEVWKAFAGFLDGTFEVGLNETLSVLDLLGMAFSDNAAESEKFEASFMRHSQVVGEAIDGIIEKLKFLKDMFNWDNFKATVNEALDGVDMVVSKVTGLPTRKDQERAALYASNERAPATPWNPDSIREAFAPAPAAAVGGAGNTTVSAPITNYYTLPAGTPAQVIKAAGDAGAKGAQKGVNRAAAAAFKGKT